MNEIIALILSGFMAVGAIFIMQLKRMSHILIAEVMVNLLAAASYLLTGGISGAVLSVVAILQALASFIMDKKNIKARIPVTVAAIAVYTVSSFMSYKDLWDLFPYLAVVCYALSIAQKKAYAFRIFGFINTAFWIFYDPHVRNWGNLAVHVGVILSLTVAILRYDIIPYFKRRKERGDTADTEATEGDTKEASAGAQDTSESEC